jgi:hypothetical protein
MIWKKNVDTIFGEGASAFFFGKIYDIWKYDFEKGTQI